MNPQDTEHANSIWALFHLPSHWPVQTDLLQWCQDMRPGEAAILVMAGVVYLLFGWYIFKALVTINAGLVGAFIGGRVGQHLGSFAAGACVGGVVAAAAAWPLMKYAVAVMGGLFGALLGASIWRAVGLDGNLAWAGALMGLIAFGMLSFIVFRASVIMYTSLQGSVMLIFGILGLIYKYPELAPKITANMQGQPGLLAMAIFFPMILGLIYQQTQLGNPEGAKKK
ncbi:MAG TPA: hypothetical protein VHD56_05915 [Tepidisphaeraceae bacterium]|nr:hypothetical protein [Tepidisphaeraceae bacterium]